MTPSWFVPRRYKHLDVVVKPEFASAVLNPYFVSRHSFVPLIAYEKRERRCKPDLRKTVFKLRPIMYASHRDACILSYYSWRLSGLLEERYASLNIGENVIAYRALGKGNYHFSADALRFAAKNSPCKILAFDVSGFFNGLNHGLLKQRLKAILGQPELSKDWYAVLRHVTRFRYISRDEVKAHPVFGPRLKDRRRRLIGTIGELKAGGIHVQSNALPFGIPQGTPISSTLANLYMIDFDQAAAAFCATLGAFYRRYSDDLIFICREAYSSVGRRTPRTLNVTLTPQLTPRS